MSTTTRTPDFPNCYVCGSDNPEGLHIVFEPDGSDGCRARYTARPEHCGWPGLIHGGLLFTLMDEAVAWALVYAGLHGVTARGDVRFAAPVKVGMPLVVTARVLLRRGKLAKARAEIREAGDGETLVAELTTAMYLTDAEETGGETRGPSQTE